MCLVYDVQIVDLVLARPQLLQDLDILTGSPDGVDGHIERVCLVEKKRQF